MNGRILPVALWCLCLMTAGFTAAAQGPSAKVPEVPVARPAQREVADYEVFSGRSEAASRVDLRCCVSGYLLKAPFREGSDVKLGDLLFEIDPRLYRAELDKADAGLGLAEATLKLAQANHKRAQLLVGRGAVSQEDFNKAAAELAAAETGLRVARAGRDAAQLNLEYTRVLAPVAGRIGRRLVDPGNVVKANETVLAFLVSVEPMHVYFDIDERTFLRLARSLRDGTKMEKVPVAIALADENGFPHLGRLDFADNQVDPSTGTLRLRAVLGNKQGLFVPGMFVRTRLTVSAPYKVLLVPARAVMVEDDERFVYVVNDNNVLETRPVTLGGQHDGLRMVKSGLKAEDRVVIGGRGWTHCLKSSRRTRRRAPARLPLPCRAAPRGRAFSWKPSTRAPAPLSSPTACAAPSSIWLAVSSTCSTCARAARTTASSPSPSPSRATLICSAPNC